VQGDRKGRPYSVRLLVSFLSLMLIGGPQGSPDRLSSFYFRFCPIH